jgi:hypothetical protein
MKLPSSSRLTFLSNTNRSLSAIPILGLLFGLATSILPAMAQKQIDLPEQTGILIGSSVRGYWFTAPKDFAITGVEVPTDASEGNQSIAVVRFAAEPPLFDATTNDFEVLFLTQDDSATGMIPTYLEIASGDVIGVLGSREGIASYASGPYASSIDGLPITLRRLGMQFPLASTAPQNLWTDEGDSISRVRLFYGPVYDPMIAESSPPKRNLKKKKKQRRSGIRPPRAVTPY